jgi:galactose mutarotase-like enzyme
LSKAVVRRSDLVALVSPSRSGDPWEFVAGHGDRLQIVPERGGLVTGWVCGGPWGEREILYFDAERFADPSKSVRGGIPVLFPICGGLPGSSLPQHGFARDLPWQIEELADGSGVRLSLTDSPETLALIPHPFRLELELRLEPQALAIRARVSHADELDEEALPFSLGLHPYFAVPDLGAVRLSGLPAEGLDQAAGVTASTADLLSRLPDGVDLLAGPAAAVRLETGSHVVVLETSAPLDLAVVWTDPPRPMVCLEPWTAGRGALNSGERLLTVPPGESLELSCRYRVEAL